MEETLKKMHCKPIKLKQLQHIYWMTRFRPYVNEPPKIVRESAIASTYQSQ